MTTSNPFLEKCAVLAARQEPKSQEEKGPEKAPTLATIATDAARVLADTRTETPSLSDIAKPN